MGLAGVKVDEDYKRYYPFDSLASKVLGFTGGDNQGIIGLEVRYESYLKGRNGRILTLTDARGVELPESQEERIEPSAGWDLHVSLDVNIQKYAEQLAYQTLERKNARNVSIIVMNPQNGEILAMVNAPEFNLNDPFTLDQNLASERLRQEAAGRGEAAGEKKQELLTALAAEMMKQTDPLPVPHYRYRVKVHPKGFWHQDFVADDPGVRKMKPIGERYLEEE